MQGWEIREGDALERLAEMPDESVQCCVTSPPYFGLRDYGTGEWDGGDDGCDHLRATEHQKQGASSLRAGRTNVEAQRNENFRDECGKCGASRVDRQIGLERSPDEFVARLVEVFREVRRVLRTDGTFWLNIGDSYNAYNGNRGPAAGLNAVADEQRNAPERGLTWTGAKPKDLLGIPWLLAFALRADGWYLRSDVIWAKPNPMPESVTDRPTSAHEHVFLLAKSPTYFYDAGAIREPSKYPEDNRKARQKQADYADSQTQRRMLVNPSKATTYPQRNKRNVWEVATQPFTGWALGARRVPVAAGDADDDTQRITSPDCPVHGDRSVPAPTAGRGGRANARSPHSPDSSVGHAQAPLHGFAPTGPSRVPDSDPDSSGSPWPSRSDAATPNSTESRRTDHAPATSPACTPFAQTEIHTDGTSSPPASSAPRPDTLDRNSDEDGSGGPRWSGTYDRTAHRPSRQDASACTCEHYKVEQTDHFATFPPKLIEPCILAGSSPKACGVCGAPWERVVEREVPIDPGRSGASKVQADDPALVDASSLAARTATRRLGQAYQDQLDANPRRTTGWQPSCDHDDDTGRSVILDPFAGAGTTGLVALRHNRSFIGIELKPSYAEMARERIRQDAPLLNTPAELAA